VSDTTASSAEGGPLTVGELLLRKAISLALFATSSVASTVTTILAAMFTADRVFVTNAAPVAAPDGTTTIAVTGFVPRTTGFAQVIVTGVVTNTTDESEGTAQLVLVVNAVPVYTQAPMRLQGSSQQTMALVVNLDELTPPFVLPLNAVSNINAELVVTGGDMSIAAQGVQLEVEEKLWPT
jgi:hypothetical protein